MATRRRKGAWIGFGALLMIIIAAAVAIAIVLTNKDDKATTNPPPMTSRTEEPGTTTNQPTTASPPTTTSPSTTTTERPPPVVTVTARGGALRGQWVTVPEENFTYAAFRGIPYAQPPVGPLRFKAPLPVASWFGVRDATTEGSECLQSPSFMVSNLTGSEDCLYLNVYTPLPEGVKKLPVYFFIHGGLFMLGSGSSTLYGPDFFMLKNMVVVTINYRLNALECCHQLQQDMSEAQGLSITDNTRFQETSFDWNRSS
ncbi:Fatty acyl-CoA hydrolase precursor, medium chain [Frankliniella fusca]|uniref:Fatty acyl-CoA hydrolase, medium chain n=1 Tax=Frankliniella fusca TaxID=407009 RepID=A0AAE1LU14_9NEOP|nr:Fatty acyl-CoA hydrolase precursor, medium chain [Frankliniella fusca]